MKPQATTNIFRSPFNTWSAQEILNHYQMRQDVQFFAVADPAQTNRAVIDRILANEFIFNAEAHQLPADFAWTTNPSHDHEWLIMWHKFYYAVGLGKAYAETNDARYAQKWMALTEHWIDSVPLDFLPSDVMGRRIQNWIFAYYYFVELSRVTTATPQFHHKLLVSMHEQVCYLRRNLTAARNHRTLELYAIFLAAVVFPEMQGAQEWLDFARSELLENMRSDLLGDGVQCELSTDYHHIVLRNYLLVRKLAKLNNIAMPAAMDAYLRKALQFALYVHRPDGQIPSLSDGDNANFLALLELGYELFGDEEMLYVATQGQQGSAPTTTAKAFSDSGYYILRSGWGTTEPYADERYLVFDCGALGEGNHGHLDCLSFEMSAYGQPLVVDPGRYTYDESGDTNWRVLFRGTSYHNTVLVDGKNQTRYEFHKRKFKIKGAAPQHQLHAFHSENDCAFLHGSAASYEYPVRHARKIFFACGEYWIVTDLLESDSLHVYEQLFHLSATAYGKTTLSATGENWQINSPHLLLVHTAVAPAVAQIAEGFIAPTYGVKQPAPIVDFIHTAATTSFHTVMFPYKNDPPQIEVTKLLVYEGAEICADEKAVALKIAVKQGENLFTDYYCLAHTAGDYTCEKLNWSGQVLFLRRDAHGQILREFKA